MVNNLIFNLKQKLNTLQDKLKEEKKFIASILDTQPSLVVVLDTEGRIIRFNKACENITGYTIEEVQGKLIWEILLVEGEQQEIKNIFEKIKNNSSTTQNYKNHWKAKNGKLHFISWSNTVITDKNDQIKYIIATGIDITENKEQQEKINYMNFHDSLTDLYNREYLEKKLQQLDTTKEMPISIIMGDANGLKLINDTYGHIIGDQMLIEIADLLKDSCRENDIISRWGGDEFIILLPQTELEEAQTICRRINNSCSNHSIKKIPLSIALGAATKKDESDDIYDILKKSEERMYKNKLIQSEDRKRNILKSLLFTLKNQTDESKRHIKNVEKISLALGAEIGLSAIELNKLSLLAVVHDIGKITISKDILNKPGSLTAKERKLINKHPEKGHQIISSSQDLSFIATSLLHHHENWDGSGYPLGLEKYDIPLPSRIIHLAISYDAMAHGRVYKKAMEQKEIIVELQDKSGSQFDPTLVPNLIKLIKENNINYPVNKISRRLSLINDFLN